MIEFKGRVRRVIFKNEGFFIFTFVVAGGEEIKAKGTFMGTEVREHQELVLKGEWKRSKWGRDFNVKSFTEPEPDDVEGITRYLVANVKGVGWITAKRIAEHYGEKTVEILTGNPDAIWSISFLSQSQKQLIYDKLTENVAKRDISIFLSSFDVSQSIIDRIYRTLGGDAQAILTEDPYQLTKVRGFGFKKADEIATRMGIDPRAPVRVQAVIKYILEDLIAVRGHLFQNAKKLLKESNELLGGVDTELFKTSLKDLNEKGDIQIDGQRVYAAKHYYTETNSAYLLSQMMTPLHRDFDLDAFVDRYEAAHSKPSLPFKLSDEQFQALELALVSKVLVITGLPGTGKTTVLKAIVSMFETFKLRMVLMTPTGISAKRLKQVTGRQTGTIHRSLGCSHDGTWQYNDKNPHPADVVIVDEFSMVDQALFYRLLDGIQKESTLIVVGDAAQLPSVGPGNCLRELLRSGAVPTVNLTTIHRQAEASDIVINAHLINNGEELQIKSSKDPTGDFKFIQIQDEDVILDRIVYFAKGMHAKKLNFQVLSPRHAGTLGVSNLNEHLRDALNIDVGQDVASMGKKSFRVGDRVMVTRNRYNHGVFNGDIGVVVQINRKDRMIQFQVGGNDLPTVFTFSEALEDLVLAYCITIHKCVHPDTLTESEQGLLPISLLSSTGNIATPEGVRNYFRKVSNPPAKAFRIETESGYTLIVTPEHGMDSWCADSGEYGRTEASDLVVGDWLRLKMGVTVEPTVPVVLEPAPTKLNVRAKVYSVPTEMTQVFAEWLGLFVADGTRYQAGFRLVKRHQDVVDRFADLTRQLFGCRVKIGTVKGGYHMAEVNSVYLSRWLKSLGGLCPNQKAVPICVLASISELHSAFLRGLFADGSVHVKDGILDHIELRQSQSSILTTARVMLLRLGIIVGKTRGKSVEYDNIQIYGKHAAGFLEQVGFVSDFKTRAGREAKARTTDVRNRIPITKKQAKTLHKARPDAFGVYTKQNAMANGYISRDTASSVMLEALEFHHNRIVSITEIASPSMCIEVPDGHRFLQNGFSGWNSQGSEFDFVMMPMVKAFNIQLQRNLFYTAVTRARRKVMVFGHMRAMTKAIGNNRVQHRNTIFGARLQNLVALN